MQILSLTTTVASRDDAERLARDLVRRRLAACVQLDAAVQSHYRWKGQPCADAEVRLTIKSLAHLLPRLQAFIDEHHPYDLPQLLWQAMDASPAYAEWVRGELDGA